MRTVLQEYQQVKQFITWVLDDVFAEYEWVNFSVKTLVEHVRDYMQREITVISLHMASTTIWGMYMVSEQSEFLCVNEKLLTPNYELTILHELAHFLAGDRTLEIGSTEEVTEEAIKNSFRLSKDEAMVGQHIRSGKPVTMDDTRRVQLNRHLLQESRAELFVLMILDRAMAAGGDA